MNKNTKDILIYSAIGLGVSATVLFLFRKRIKQGIDAVKKIYYDLSNEYYIKELHPAIKNDVRTLYNWIVQNTDWQPISTSGYRSFEKQAALHEQNSSNAVAGSSKHNYGFAIDMNLQNTKTGGYLKKSSSKAAWNKSGVPAKAKEMGFRWGGDFTSYHDPVHFEKSPYTSSQLLALHNSGKVDRNGYVII